MSTRPDHARAIKLALTDPTRVLAALGLLDDRRAAKKQARGWIVRCPVHGEKNPSCSVQERGGVILWKCHACQAEGDVLALVAAVRGLSTKRDFRRVLIECALAGGLHAIADDLARNSERATRPPIQPAPTRPAAAEPDRTYPDACELAHLLEQTITVCEDAEAQGHLEARGIAADLVDSGGLARVIPKTATLPRWASYQRASWTETGHRLVVPVVDAWGVTKSVRAWRIVEGDAPKRLPPGGHKAAELVMACELGRAMLASAFRPARLLVVEGEPDFLVASTWRMRVPTARIGIISGSWSMALAMSIPVGLEVLVWTHRDRAGDAYAAEMVTTLQRTRGCRVRRWAPTTEEAA